MYNRGGGITAEEAAELREEEFPLLLGGVPSTVLPTDEKLGHALTLRSNAEEHLVNKVREYFPDSKPVVTFKALGTAFNPDEGLKTIVDGIELRPMFVVEFPVEAGNKENLRNYKYKLLSDLKEKFNEADNKVEIIENGGNKGNITDSDHLKFSVSGFNTHIIEAMEKGKSAGQQQARGIN
jgi:hypothetical protein